MKTICQRPRQFICRRSDRDGFTLPELLVTVALAAIAATVAAVSLAGAHRAARARDVADQVTGYDRLARDWSQRFACPCGLTFDLDRGTVQRGREGRDGQPADTGGTSPAPLNIPAPFRLQAVVTAGSWSTAGRVRVPCSARGQTPSYAVNIAGPAGQEQWIIMAGLTGQCSTAKNEAEVRDIFQTLATRGNDAR